MSGEIWAFIGVALTAVIGGSGVAGVLSGAVELSQRNRLRKRSERGLELAALLPEGGPSRRAIEHSVSVDVLRLSALSNVQLDYWQRAFAWANAGISIAYAGLLVFALSTAHDRSPSELAFEAEGRAAAAGLFAAVVVIAPQFVLAQLLRLGRRRGRFVQRVLSKGWGVSEAASHGARLQIRRLERRLSKRKSLRKREKSRS